MIVLLQDVAKPPHTMDKLSCRRWILCVLALGPSQAGSLFKLGLSLTDCAPVRESQITYSARERTPPTISRD